MRNALMGQTNSLSRQAVELLWEQEERLLWGRVAGLDSFVVQSRIPPEAVAVVARLRPCLVLHLPGPILNLLSLAASTATGGSRLWKFPTRYVRKCFILFALTQFAGSFCRKPQNSGSGK